MTFTAAAILEELQPFQLRTVEAALEALHRSPNARFLVADEVGLGKTRVARGVIAQTREERERRGETGLRVVYLSSSLAIAKQNAPLLRCGGDDAVFSTVDRVTMLPTKLKPDAALEVLAFTPGTSLSLRGRRTGTVQERALLGRLLGSAGLAGPTKGRRERLIELLGPPAPGSFPGLYDNAARATVPKRSGPAVPTALARPPARPRAPRTCRRDAPLIPEPRLKVIRALRHVLADACIDLLGAHLIVVDEFQRYLDALDVELAVKLLNSAPVLFLSATPFTNTSTEELGLLRLVELLDPAACGRAADLGSALSDLRDGLLRAGTDNGASAREAKERVEGLLRPLIARTEQEEFHGQRRGPSGYSRRARRRRHPGLRGARRHRAARRPAWRGRLLEVRAPPLELHGRLRARPEGSTNSRLAFDPTHEGHAEVGQPAPGNPATRGLLEHVATRDTGAVRGWRRASVRQSTLGAERRRPSDEAAGLLCVDRGAEGHREHGQPRRSDGGHAAFADVVPPASGPARRPDDRAHGAASQRDSGAARQPLRHRATKRWRPDVVEPVAPRGGACPAGPDPTTAFDEGRVDRRWYVAAPLLMDGDADWMCGCGAAAWSGRRSELAALVAHPTNSDASRRTCRWCSPRWPSDLRPRSCAR